MNEQYEWLLVFFSQSIMSLQNYHTYFQSWQFIGPLLIYWRGTKGKRAGETTKLHENLPNSYATDVRKFLDDTYTSLECHSKKYNQACEQIIREFETSFEAWKRISDIKEHGDKMPNHKAELREHFNEFEENVNPWMAATCQLR